MTGRTSHPTLMAIVEASRGTLLACHDRPDTDAINGVVALGLALETMGLDFKVVGGSGFPQGVGLPTRDLPITLFNPDEDAISDIDTVMILDTGTPNHLGKWASLLDQFRSLGVRIINIDHHEVNPLFGDVNIVDPGAASTCEILFHLLQDSNVTISPDIAHCLLTGVLADTNGFKTSNVTSDTLRTAAALIDFGADIRWIMHDMTDFSSIARVQVWGRVLSGIESVGSNGDIVYALVDREITTGDELYDERISGIVNFMRDIKGVQVAVLFVERGPDEIKVSLRAKPGINVRRVAELFGGGGHDVASACVIKGKALEEVQRLVLDEVKREVEGQALTLTPEAHR